MAQVDFENLLKNTIGLDTASIGSATIERAVRLRMIARGLKQADDYWDQLRTSTDELQEFIEAVVVPETWFFRDPEAFSALVSLVMEERQPIAANSVLRLLSIPCSTGEEPFSMIMSLLDGGFSPQQLHVDAVDISARALARATRGVYGLNSFRGTNLAFRDRYFQPVANGYALAEWLRSMVTFRQNNILSSDFGFCLEQYDVIFCRNLLIYFDRSTQEQVMKKLARLLTADGLLFVGPAEAFLASCSGFVSANQAMSFAFRRTAKTPARSNLSSPAHGKPADKQPCPSSRLKTATKPLSVPAPVLPKPALVSLETAQRLANEGRLDETAAWCEANLRDQGPSSETYYLLGLVHDAIGDRDGAAAFYRKAIYLEPEHMEGLMHLALITETQGNTAAAERLYERARRVERRAKERVS
jgi:chemotaxis protein methyltransferase WspC